MLVALLGYGLGPSLRGDRGAQDVGQREEREAVRGLEGQGNVQGARGTDRQQPRGLEARWPEKRLRRRLAPGWDDRSEEESRTQGWQGRTRLTTRPGRPTAGSPSTRAVTAPPCGPGAASCSSWRSWSSQLWSGCSGSTPARPQPAVTATGWRSAIPAWLAQVWTSNGRSRSGTRAASARR